MSRCLRLRLGAEGYDHPGWAGSFYPEDLPREWWAGYYAALFPAVLLPARMLDDPTLETCLAEFSPQGRVFLRAPEPALLSGSHRERLIVLAQGFPAVLAGVLAVSPAQAQGLRAQLGESIQVLGDTQAPVWRPDADAAHAGLGLLPTPPDLRTLRRWIDSFTSASESTDCTLILEGNPPSLGGLEQGRTLLEVMGW